jgi:hypothetical protein
VRTGGTVAAPAGAAATSERAKAVAVLLRLRLLLRLLRLSPTAWLVPVGIARDRAAALLFCAGLLTAVQARPSRVTRLGACHTGTSSSTGARCCTALPDDIVSTRTELPLCKMASAKSPYKLHWRRLHASPSRHQPARQCTAWSSLRARAYRPRAAGALRAAARTAVRRGGPGSRAEGLAERGYRLPSVGDDGGRATTTSTCVSAGGNAEG